MVLVTRHLEVGQMTSYMNLAPLVVSACLELLDDDAPRGVRAPGELFDARGFLDPLAPEIDVTLSA